jgi:DNA-binding NtrC family response regulator
LQARVLIADCGGGAVSELAGMLEARGYRVECVRHERVTWEHIDELRSIGEGPHALLVELSSRGRGLLERLSELPTDLAVIALLPRGADCSPVVPLRLGADEALSLPVDPEELSLRLARAIERSQHTPLHDKRGDGAGRAGPSLLLGTSLALRRVREQIARVAPGRATVLLTGETGTGKELVATAIHETSPRRGRPLVKVNCAALPETLLESELFGHDRGAFTGAEHRRIGRFEEAHGGTLFLDEVGDMHPRTQAKVLRVLQEREFERLGGSRPIRVDVRIIAATNQELEDRIADGSFRSDLYFRLNVVSIQLPPLRERPEDITVLAEVFLREFNNEIPAPRLGFTPKAIEDLLAYPWPGNVRELRNVVQRAVLMGSGPWVEPGDLGLPRDRAMPIGRPVTSGGSIQLPEGGVDLEEVERVLIVQALERAGWVQKDAARLLHMSRRRLNYRIAKLGITHPSWRRNRPPARGPK